VDGGYGGWQFQCAFRALRGSDAEWTVDFDAVKLLAVSSQLSTKMNEFES
jgi:hypothetical protein